MKKKLIYLSFLTLLAISPARAGGVEELLKRAGPIFKVLAILFGVNVANAPMGPCDSIYSADGKTKIPADRYGGTKCVKTLPKKK